MSSPLPIIDSTWALIILCSLSIAAHHHSSQHPVLFWAVFRITFNPKLSFFSLIIFTLHQPTYFTLPNTSESVCHQTACPMGSKFAILLDVNIPSAVSSLSLTNHHLKSRRKGKPDTHSLHVSEKSIHSFLNNSLILQPWALRIGRSLSLTAWMLITQKLPLCMTSGKM